MIEKSLSLIKASLAKAENPAIAWSSGKDSQVLLWLVQQVNKDVPLVFFRNADDPARFVFADHFIAENNLTVYLPEPEHYDVVANGEEMEILTTRSLAPDSYAFCGIGIDKSVKPERCGLQVINRPRVAPSLYFDVVFVGHRSDDVCPIQGAIPLQAPAALLANCTLVYPLQDWTEKDVWDVIEAERIPLDPLRYDLANRREWASKRYNPDYDALCVNCLQGEGEVDCLLAGKTSSIASQIQPERRAQVYRQQFVNLSV